MFFKRSDIACPERENYCDFLKDLADALIKSKPKKSLPAIEYLADQARRTAKKISDSSFSEEDCRRQIQLDLFPMILDIYCIYRKTNWLGRSTRDSALQACSAAIASTSKAAKHQPISNLPVLMKIPGVVYSSEQKAPIDPFESKKPLPAKKAPKSDNESLILRAISPELFDPIIKDHFSKAIEKGLDMGRAGRMYLINCIKAVNPERANAVEYWNNLVKTYFVNDKGKPNEAGKLLIFPTSALEKDIIAKVDKCLALPDLFQLSIDAKARMKKNAADTSLESKTSYKG